MSMARRPRDEARVFVPTFCAVARQQIWWLGLDRSIILHIGNAFYQMCTGALSKNIDYFLLYFNIAAAADFQTDSYKDGDELEEERSEDNVENMDVSDTCKNVKQNISDNKRRKVVFVPWCLSVDVGGG